MSPRIVQTMAQTIATDGQGRPHYEVHLPTGVNFLDFTFNL